MMYNHVKVDYDNRFGFAKYCSAYWKCDRNRVGEQFLFSFRNGVSVSIIRTATWNYLGVASNLSTAASYGFTCGLYEALVSDSRGNELEQKGYLNHKEVKRLLSKWRNVNS